MYYYNYFASQCTITMLYVSKCFIDFMWSENELLRGLTICEVRLTFWEGWLYVKWDWFSERVDYMWNETDLLRELTICEVRLTLWEALLEVSSGGGPTVRATEKPESLMRLTTSLWCIQEVSTLLTARMRSPTCSRPHRAAGEDSWMWPEGRHVKTSSVK